MKKLIYLIVLALILGLVLAGCSLLSNIGQAPATEQSGITYLTKHTEDAPQVADLLAGQDINVGTVKVWNDEDYLYAKYETIDGWEMTETHLAVATSLDGIPQAKGNPIPGKFPYSTIHDPAVTELTYTIPLAGLGTSPYIAAHAKVQLPQLLSAPITASIASGDSLYSVLLDNVLHIAEDTINPGYPTGYSGPYAGTPSPAVLTWTHGSWPIITGAQWISSASLVEDPDFNSWRLFTRNFVIPSNAVNITGTLMMMTADNAEEVYLNSILIGSDGEVYGPFVDNQEWNTIETFSDLNLLPGTNTLEVMVRNYAWLGGPEANPTGLIYKMDYQYQIVERELQTETAWADGTGFTGKNWATYFTYTVQPVLLETVKVYANNGTPTYSSITLEDGKSYLLKASGTAFAGDTIWFDAKYSTSSYSSPLGTWTDSVAHYEGYGPDLLNLAVDGVFVDWGVYNLAHVYYWNMTGDGSPLGIALWIYDIYYPNNSDFLTVDIYWMP